MPTPPKTTVEQREAARRLAVAAYVEKCRVAREAKERQIREHTIGPGDRVSYCGWTWKVGRVDSGYAFIQRGGREKRVPVGALTIRVIAK